MKSKLALSLAAACSLCLLPALTYAGNNGQSEAKSDHSDKVRTMTGCLEKEGNEYELRTDNGATWELEGDSVNLADHVGHTIRVTGTVNHAKMHDEKEKAKEKTESNPSEHGHITVTNVKHIKAGCSK
jgi:Protein of unknown function (DUF5818)